MRRSAVSLAVIAILLAPMHAFGAMGIGCDGVVAASCCCPTSAGHGAERDDRARGASLERTCCCDIRPVSASSPVPPAGLAANDAPAAAPAAEQVYSASAPLASRTARYLARARAPPATAATLLDQHVALLL